MAVAPIIRSIPRELSAPLEVWLWPNVLNLDAPLVAVLWQLLLAKSMRLPLNPWEPWALALTVWLIYIADHLIDTTRPRSGEWEAPRKLFCRAHWHTGLAVGIAVGLALAVCGSRLLWASTVQGGVQLGCAVAGYFSLRHLTPVRWRIRWPREVVVALLFTLGTFGAVWLGSGRNWAILAAPAAIFLLLCWTNCSLIETWEWEAGACAGFSGPNRAARWAAGHVGVVAGIIACLALINPNAFSAAGALSGGALWALATKRRALAIRFVSPVADLALCSPLLFLLVS